MIPQALEILKQSRKNQRAIIDGLSVDQVNKIPAGFNNNIIWNFAHAVVTQQLLCYKLSGLPLLIEDAWVEQFAKGTTPTKAYTQSLIEDIKSASERLPLVLVEDYGAGKFSAFTSYPTSYGYELNSVEDAIMFNNVHEGLHYGYMLALKRALKS